MDYLVVDCIGVITKDDAIVGMKNLLIPKMGCFNLLYIQSTSCAIGIFSTKRISPSGKAKPFKRSYEQGSYAIRPPSSTRRGY